MAFGHHVHVAHRLEQIAQFIACELFVIHDYRRKGHRSDLRL
jgi:hypothetical protein